MPITRSSRKTGERLRAGVSVAGALWAGLSVGVAQAPPAGQASAASRPLTPAEQLVKAYIDAVGGQSVLDSVKSWELTGHPLDTKRFNPDKTKLVLFWKAPEKARATIKTLNSDVAEGFDGQRAWILRQHGHGHKLSMEKQDILQIICNPLRFTRLPVIYPGVAMEGKGKVEGRDVTVLLSNVQWGDRRFSFDDETHYLVQIEDHFKSGDPPRFTRLRDYQGVEGLRIPHVIEQNWMDQLEGGGVRIVKVKLNVPIRDVTFENPR